MKFVSASFGRHRDETSGAVTDLSIDAVLGDDYFLNGISVWWITSFMAQTDRAAVHLQIVCQICAASQIYAVHRPGLIGLHFAPGVYSCGSKQRQFKRISVEP